MKERVETINNILTSRDAGFRVEYQKVWKNNAVREGYVLRSKDPKKNASPVMYRGEWFDSGSDEEICDCLCQAESQYNMAIDLHAIIDCDNVREKILPRIVSADNSDSLINMDICYCEVAGGALLACYYLPITLPDGQDASVPVTNAILALADISPSEAYEAAVKNMAATIDVLTMDEILAEFTGMPKEEITGRVPQLIVATNTKRQYGAAAILCPELLDILKAKIGHDQKGRIMEDTFSNYAILPSSIHETILTEFTSDADLLQLREMVRKVNDTEVSPEDRLSYSVFGWKNGSVCAIA